MASERHRARHLGYLSELHRHDWAVRVAVYTPQHPAAARSVVQADYTQSGIRAHGAHRS